MQKLVAGQRKGVIWKYYSVSWKERRPFWKNKKITGCSDGERVTDAAATLGSVS